MKDIIKLIYVKDGNEYTTEINRALFLDQMERFVDWYSADGSNSGLFHDERGSDCAGNEIK